MVQINQLRLNYGAMKNGTRGRISCSCNPVFSWAVISDKQNSEQKACRIRVWCAEQLLWDTGWIETAEQQITYNGNTLPSERKICFTAEVRDNQGETSLPAEEYFYVSGLPNYSPTWIAADQDEQGKAVYFRHDLHFQKKPVHATLYVCGIGYHAVTINGVPLDESVLDPATADYSRTVYYVMTPELESRLTKGDNCIGVVLGEGWRRNEGQYLHCIGDRSVEFFGIPQLSVILNVEYEDGASQVIKSDENWLCGYGAITYNHLFNGETTDYRKAIPGWDTVGGCTELFCHAKEVPSPGGKATVMELEPILEQEIYPAQTITPLKGNMQVVDFGQNIAGVCRLRLPKNLKAGQTITIDHMEFLDDDGSLYLPNLRGAKCRDTYIAAGNGQDPQYWQPQFTYHGFQYAQVTGLPLLQPEDIKAVSLYTDVASKSFFRCGSGLVNEIQKAIVQTEKANIHSILTDCPQRDERMGWMNDATVRFEETPYNFDIGRLFPKIIADIADTQAEDGSITCTAPRIYGERPADPVCSSFLVAGMQALLHTGNRHVIEQAFEPYVRWEECLGTYTDEYIVNYSYYGDWAGPVYACVDGDHDLNAVHSLHTPGIFMSTGYYYYNAVLIAQFAALLNKPQEEQRFAELAENIREAMLKKWWNSETGQMATGSQGCQSFALWLGIIPEEKRALAALRLHEDLVERNYRITTANLCTRYIMDALTQNGYVDDAWRLITSEEYPSLGYMLQNEATTIWERFELKKEPGMNSHNHPMYGAVGYWFYAYIAGIRPTAPGFSEVTVQPYFPKGLLSANAAVDTVKGALIVRWVKQFGETRLFVTVPFGVKATVVFDGKKHQVGSGYWVFKK